MTPLYRAAMAVSLENAGVERALVGADGKVTERPYSNPNRVALKDPAFIVQACVEADMIIELLTGEPFRGGELVLKGLKIRNVQVAYEKRREVGHEFSPFHLREVLIKAARIVGDKL
jgi:hypothetical protein